VGIQGERQLLPLGVGELASGPSVGDQIVAIDIRIVFDYIALPSHQDEIGEVGRERVVAECAGGCGFGFGLQLTPGCGPIVEAAGVELPEDAGFCAEAAVEVDVAGLDTGGEVGARREVVAEFQLHPSRVDLLPWLGGQLRRRHLQQR
jgi:hypothetical protein